MVYTVYWHTDYRYNDNDICDILLREKPPLSWQGEPRQDSTPAITFGLSHRLLLLLLLLLLFFVVVVDVVVVVHKSPFNLTERGW